MLSLLKTLLLTNWEKRVLSGNQRVQDLYKQKRSLELRWQLEYEQNGKYTLDMVQIDNKIKEVISEIKAEERKIADRELAIINSAPEVSVAT
jgi:hypothetical protein